MKSGFFVTFLALCALVYTLPTWAEESTSTQSTTQSSELKVQQLMARAEALQKAMVELQKEIQTLQAQKVSQSTQKDTTQTASETSHETSSIKTPLYARVEHEGVSLEKHLSHHYHPIALEADGTVLTYIAGTPVVTSPYLGEGPAFDASDVIINISKVNQDLRLMERRAVMEKSFESHGLSAPETPIIALSGKLEPYAIASDPYVGDPSWDIDLGSAELDIAATFNPWTEGLISFAYDAAPPATGGQRISNSSVSVDRAFVNVGNLNETPVYFTTGQFYMPFGQYSSNMVSSPVTLSLGRVQARAVMLGYKHLEPEGIYGGVFGYKTDTTGGQDLAGGGSLAYDFSEGPASGRLGASVVSNIADSNGMQSTGGSGGAFSGFGTSSATEAVTQVPGYDVQGLLNYGPYGLIAEWVTAAESFETSDLSFNGTGALPQALNVEGSYSFQSAKKPTAVALGYSVTQDALALFLPRERYSAVVNVSWWRDTVESLEYRHDVDYAESDSAAGIGSTVATTGTGHSSDTVTAQLGVYF